MGKELQSNKRYRTQEIQVIGEEDTRCGIQAAG
jgi:hypothetical protein